MAAHSLDSVTKARRVGYFGPAGTFTEQALVTPAGQANRDRVTQFLTREDVRKSLTEQGVSADDAIARVQAMSDAEVAQLARSRGLAMHLDGARMFNAATANAARHGTDVYEEARTLCNHFDSVSL